MSTDHTGKATPSGGELPPEEKRGTYAAIFGRRDVRAFHSDRIPDDVLARVLTAAHHAPSVGFMQPWDFLLVGSRSTRERVKELSDRERRAAAVFFDEPRRDKYLSMKLEGILDAPLNLCVTCDPTRGGRRSSGATASRRPTYTARASPSRTCGSQPVRRASGSAGSASCATPSCATSWASRHT